MCAFHHPEGCVLSRLPEACSLSCCLPEACVLFRLPTTCVISRQPEACVHARLAEVCVLSRLPEARVVISLPEAQCFSGCLKPSAFWAAWSSVFARLPGALSEPGCVVSLPLQSSQFSPHLEKHNASCAQPPVCFATITELSRSPFVFFSTITKLKAITEAGICHRMLTDYGLTCFEVI